MEYIVFIYDVHTVSKIDNI